MNDKFNITCISWHELQESNIDLRILSRQRQHDKWLVESNSKNRQLIRRRSKCSDKGYK